MATAPESHELISCGIGQARQKAHITPLRNNTTIGKLSERSNSSSAKSLEEDKPIILVDETSFYILESATKCAYITYLNFGPDGQWARILFQPAECFDKFRGLIDMDGLCVVSPAPIIPFSLNHPKYLRSIWHTYSTDPVVEAKYSGIDRQRCSQQKALANKCVKPNVSSCSCSVWSDVMPGIPDTPSLSENCKVPRRKSKKKAKKKRKQSKKLQSDAGLVGAEALSVPFSSGISTAKPFADYDMELDLSAPSTSDLVDFSPSIYDTQIVRGDRSGGVSPTFLMDTHLNMSYQSGSRGSETEEFVHFGAAKDTFHQQINCFECDTEVSFGNHDSVVSDSGFTGLNSVDSGDTIYDVTNNSHLISRETSTFVGNYVSSESSSFLSVEFSTQTKGRKISSKESSTGDVRMYTKRGNNVNSMPGRCANKRTGHGHFGKENIHTVWKKVHKTDSCSVYSMEKNNSRSSGFGVTSRGEPRHEGYCNVKLSAADDLNEKIARRPRNKIAPEAQQKGNCPSRKEYYPKKERLSMLLKVNQENRRSFNDAAQKKIKQARGSNSRYHTLSNSRVELHNNKLDCTTRTSVPGIKVHPHDLRTPEIVLTTNHKIDAQNSEVKYSLPSESDSSVDLSICLDQVQPGKPAVKDDDIRMEKEAPFPSNGKKDYNSGFVLQKWIPVGRKVPCPTGLQRSDTSLLLHFDKPETVNGCSKTITHLSCDSTPSVTSEVQHPSPIFEKLEDSKEGIIDAEKLTSEITVVSNSKSKFGSLIGGVKEVQISSSDIYLKKITSAVEDTFRVQVESEALREAIGSPIAGFEKFLHSACPVILKVDGAFKCRLCHIDPAAIFLCTHELQSISLGSLWEWYERHGSYGLEVREDRYNDPTIIGHREFGLRAYFVPYLSAVQLFGKCRNGFANGLKCLRPDIPRPCTEAVRLSLPDFESVDNDTIARTAVSRRSYELIFEYFESEQPRRRHPLFDKIKELAEGEGSQQQVYGDPAILTSIDICDLHPRSWYSVAWYPIYKIPDGNFRAAFLTYHSLGHLVHREASSNSSQLEIVSPIVGLLSCNARCEGWFHPIDSEAQKSGDTTHLSLPEIIQERLRTLEHTAGLFATSTVSKGKVTSINRHPDYDFFTSRRR